MSPRREEHHRVQKSSSMTLLFQPGSAWGIRNWVVNDDGEWKLKTDQRRCCDRVEGLLIPLTALESCLYLYSRLLPSRQWSWPMFCKPAWAPPWLWPLADVGEAVKRTRWRARESTHPCAECTSHALPGPSLPLLTPRLIFSFFDSSISYFKADGKQCF